MKKTFLADLTDFFRAARHLWGRCPCCGELFRLSDAAVSFGSEPPRDWLRRLQRQRDALTNKLAEIDALEEELVAREDDVDSRERDVDRRASNLNREVKRLALEYLRSDSRVKQLVRESSKSAVLKSRATLLGKLFERLSPFFQRFNHDPRDIRPIMEPIDYVCFDGLTVSRRVSRITFVEVKAGTSSVTPCEGSILRAVKDGRVDTEVWRFGSKALPLQQQLTR
jgi:predicted Holliday junction resolvase-like endonuclease